MAVICENLKKSYQAPDGTSVSVIDVEHLEIEDGSQVAIVGTSGSGKTTFLNMIAGILTPDSGSVFVDGTDITKLSEQQRDRFRGENTGYIFQTFNLLPSYTALENVMLGMYFVCANRSRMHQEAKSLLEEVGLADRMHYMPRQLSTGQQQRVSIARALANQHKLILADEPTGNLDGDTSERILDLIQGIIEREKRTLVFVTHDPKVIKRFSNVKNIDELQAS